MEQFEIRLLRKLTEITEPIGTSELASILEVSKSKIKNTIRDLNRDLEPYDAQIIGKTGLGNGYRLVISDQKRFDSYLNKVLPAKLAKGEGLFSNQEARVNYIMQRLLQSDDFIKADDIAEELFISRNQLSKDLKLVRSKMKDVGIEIVNKPYYGLGIEADELLIRQCLAKMESEKILSSSYTTAYSEYANENIVLAQIQTIIIDECAKYHYQLDDMTCQNLVTHLYIAVKRAERKYLVEFSEQDKKQIEEEKEFDLAKAIIYDIQSLLGVSLSRNEIYYCTIHLSAKKSVGTDYTVSPEIQSLVKRMLNYLDQVRKTDFSCDFKLALRLSLHMVPLVSRINYSLELKNPLFEEIKSRYIQAYDYASVCADYLNREFGTTISEHEISYFALHFQLSMNDSRTEDRKNILIICSTGRGSAALLKAKFKKEYGKYLDKITLCDYLNVLKTDVSQFDYIFSTIPLKNFDHPYLLISHFISSEDDRQIIRILEGNEENFYRYFERELFIAPVEASTKEEAIFRMTENIRRFRQIPDSFYDGVMKREELANTCFAKNIAMPHPYEILTEDTFISIGILKEPIVWDGEEKVKIVFLCSFAAKFAKQNDEFFERLSEIISSRTTVRKLSNAQTYDEFINVMKEQLGD